MIRENEIEQLLRFKELVKLAYTEKGIYTNTGDEEYKFRAIFRNKIIKRVIYEGRKLDRDLSLIPEVTQGDFIV